MQNIVIAGISLGVILVVTALLDIVLLGGLIYGRTIGAAFKFLTKRSIEPRILAILGLIVGVLMLGGIGATFSTLTAPLQKAAISGDEQLAKETCVIDYARYKVITFSPLGSGAVNWSTDADDTDLSHYYIDSKTARGIITSGIDINGSLTLYAKEAPSTGEECNAIVYAVGPSYKTNDTQSVDSDAIFDLLDEGTTTTEIPVKTENRIDSVVWVQNAYLKDEAGAGAAGTSDSQEWTYVNFDAGEQSKVLGFGFDLSQTSWDYLERYKQVDILFKQQLGDAPSSGDPTIYRITLRKGNLG